MAVHGFLSSLVAPMASIRELDPPRGFPQSEARVVSTRSRFIDPTKLFAVFSQDLCQVPDSFGTGAAGDLFEAWLP